KEEELELVKLLQKTPLLKDGPPELRQGLEQRLVAFLKWEPPIDMKMRLAAGGHPAQPYAEYFPKLRAAAIETLVDLGTQSPDAIEAIRGHISPVPIKIGDKEYLKGESDANVRAAAIEALKKLQDSKLREIINVLIDGEDDPNINVVLRD